MDLKFYSDSGHGWLEVPTEELKRLRITGDISGYSYKRGKMAYLEEDADAGVYLDALAASGEERPNITNIYVDGRAAIREYSRYR